MEIEWPGEAPHSLHRKQETENRNQATPTRPFPISYGVDVSYGVASTGPKRWIEGFRGEQVKEFAYRHGWPAKKDIDRFNYFIWLARLAIESAKLEPYPVGAPPVPEGLSEQGQKSY